MLRQPKNFRIHYAVALTLVAVLVSLSASLFFSVLQQQTLDAEKINVSGSQRMLSQKIALYTQRLGQAGNAEQERVLLQQALQRFERNYHDLTADEQTLSPAVRRLYFDGEPSLETLIQQYITATQAVLNTSPPASSTDYHQSDYTELLLQKLDAVVKQLEVEAQERVSTLIMLERGVWMLTLLLLLWEARYIFYPMERAIKTHIQRLQQKINAIQQLENEKIYLEKVANLDPLTGLYSLKGARTFLTKMLADPDHTNRKLAVLFVDLDDFKPINDRYGHDTGDHILIETARRIKQELRGRDIACRIGGDEFLLVIEDVFLLSQLEHLCERLLRVIAARHRLQGDEICVSASIGCALFPEHSTSAETLKKLADAAMYKAKRSGKNRYLIHGATVKNVDHLRTE